MCVHVWGHPPCPRCPHTHLPLPQSYREPKSLTVNKSWTNWDNLILFEKFFTSEHFWIYIDSPWSPQISPTHLPHHWSRRHSNHENSIKCEWIEILFELRFCFKICNPWALPHTYRLGLMCRWGVSHPKWHFYVSNPKSTYFLLLWLPRQNFFPFLHWIP